MSGDAIGKGLVIVALVASVVGFALAVTAGDRGHMAWFGWWWVANRWALWWWSREETDEGDIAP